MFGSLSRAVSTKRKGGADIWEDCVMQSTPSFAGTPMGSSLRVTS